MYVCVYYDIIFDISLLDVTEGEMVMLYGSLSPANLGSITCYLPVLISDIL